MLELPAYAKINLSLEVTGKRPDGYHDIISVMQLVSLHDTLTFEVASDLQLLSDDPAMLREGDNNLVIRAARLLQDTFNATAGARITLHKRIPMAGGLGGGSSDAATALMGLSQLWGLNLPSQQLAGLGAALGSDVPFFFFGPTALVEGRGERVTPLSPPEPFSAVLVSQPYPIAGKTRQLYASLTPDDMREGSTTRELLHALRQGMEITSMPLFNSFERAAYQVFTGLADVRRRMLEAGAPNVHLSGSGPTLYALYPHDAANEARGLYINLVQKGLRAFCVASQI